MYVFFSRAGGGGELEVKGLAELECVVHRQRSKAVESESGQGFFLQKDAENACTKLGVVTNIE